MEFNFRGVTAISGRPGVGKTSLAMRIAHEYLTRGKRVLWVSLYEDRETFLENATRLGYDLSNAEFWDMIFVRPDIILNQIVSAVSQNEYHLVVADSISALIEGTQSREWLINAVYRVFKPAKIDFIGIAEEETTTPLDYIADNLIRLELRMENGVAERRMCIIKARGRRAGYYIEFDILEGRGVVFIDELPKPHKRGPWNKWVESLSPAFGPLAGGHVYFLVGKMVTPLLAKTAAELSKEGLRVLYRVFSGDVDVISKLVEKFGGKAVVQRASPSPLSHFTHVKSLYDALTETDADVVVSEGIDVEYLVYGRKALEINRLETDELRNLGITILAGAKRDFGFRYFADAVAYIKRDQAVVYTPSGRAVCRFETQPAPRLVC